MVSVRLMSAHGAIRDFNLAGDWRPAWLIYNGKCYAHGGRPGGWQDNPYVELALHEVDDSMRRRAPEPEAEW